MDPGQYCMAMMQRRDSAQIAAADFADMDTAKVKRQKVQGNSKETEDDDSYMPGGH